MRKGRTAEGAGVLFVVLGQVGEKVAEPPFFKEADERGHQSFVQGGWDLWVGRWVG